MCGGEVLNGKTTDVYSVLLYAEQRCFDTKKEGSGKESGAVNASTSCGSACAILGAQA